MYGTMTTHFDEHRQSATMSEICSLDSMLTTTAPSKVTFRCEPCNKNFGTALQSAIHKKSKLHKRKLRTNSKKALENEAEKLVAAAERGLTSMGLSAPSEVQAAADEAFLSEHMSSIDTDAETNDAIADDLYCATCDVKFGSCWQARNHKQSKKHKVVERAQLRAEREVAMAAFFG